jgi:hypothetical protein
MTLDLKWLAGYTRRAQSRDPLRRTDTPTISHFLVFAGLEARMAKTKLKASLSPIAAQIDKTAAQLKSLRSQASSAGQKKIDLEIKKLKKVRKGLAAICHNMTVFFDASSKE